jgi:hypothetical protein
MRKNKYIIFAAIGFELVGFILGAIFLGNYLLKKGYGQATQVFLILGAFLIWFISLIVKLKKMKND